PVHLRLRAPAHEGSQLHDLLAGQPVTGPRRKYGADRAVDPVPGAGRDTPDPCPDRASHRFRYPLETADRLLALDVAMIAPQQLVPTIAGKRDRHAPPRELADPKGRYL